MIMFSIDEQRQQDSSAKLVERHSLLDPRPFFRMFAYSTTTTTTTAAATKMRKMRARKRKEGNNHRILKTIKICNQFDRQNSTINVQFNSI